MSLVEQALRSESSRPLSEPNESLVASMPQFMLILHSLMPSPAMTCLGSEADVGWFSRGVLSIPESGHRAEHAACPLWARSGHRWARANELTRIQHIGQMIDISSACPWASRAGNIQEL